MVSFTLVPMHNKHVEYLNLSLHVQLNNKNNVYYDDVQIIQAQPCMIKDALKDSGKGYPLLFVERGTADNEGGTNTVKSIVLRKYSDRYFDDEVRREEFIENAALLTAKDELELLLKFMRDVDDFAWQDDPAHAFEDEFDLVWKRIRFLQWVVLIEEGITVYEQSPVMRGVHYEVFWPNPAQIRTATLPMGRTDMKDLYVENALDSRLVEILNKMAPEKQCQQMTFCMSSARKWSDVFPDIPMPRTSHMAIFEDCDLTKTNEKFVASDDEYAFVVQVGDVTETISDGSGMYIYDDRNMSDEERKELLESDTLKSLGVRMSKMGFKGAWHCVLRSSVVKYMELRGKKQFTDAYGHRWTTKRLPDIISFKSSLKISKIVKERKLYDELFEEDREIWVTIVEHDNKPKDVPAQVMQAMDFDKATAKELADDTYSLLKAYCGPKAGKLVGGWHGKAADLWPVLRGDVAFMETHDAAIKNKAHKAIGGQYLEACRYHIVHQDPAALLDYILGCPVVGLIPRNCAVCRKYRHYTKMATFRMPNNDNNIEIWMNNLKIIEGWEGLYIGTCLYVSCRGLSMTCKQMDFDGDKVGVIVKPKLVKLCEKALKAQNALPLKLRSLKAPAGKAEYTKEDLNKFFMGMINAPVGLVSQAATKAWSFFRGNNTNIGWQLKYAASEECTLVIDLAKHPIEGIGTVLTVEDMIRALNPILGEAMFGKKGVLKYVQMPRYNAWAKSSWTAEGLSDWKKRINSSNFAFLSGLDWYSQYVRANVEAGTNEQSGDLKLDQLFDWNGGKEGAKASKNATAVGRAVASMFIADNKRCRINGFAEIVKRHLENKAVIDSNSRQPAASKVMAQASDLKILKEELLAAAKAAGKDAVAAFATLAYCTENRFTTQDGCNPKEYRRLFWRTFGEEAYNNLEANLKVDGLWEQLLGEATVEYAICNSEESIQEALSVFDEDEYVPDDEECEWFSSDDDCEEE